MSERSARIAQIGLRGIESSSIGGIETVVRTLVGGIMSFRLSIYVRTGGVVPGGSTDNCTLINIPTANLAVFDTFVYSFIATIYACVRDDIIHYHGVGPAIFCWLPRLFGRKVIVTVHALDWNREKWGYMATLILRAGAFIASKAAHIITAVSTPIQEYFRSNYDREVQLIPNGVDVEELKIAHTSPGKSSLGNYFLFIGRLVPEKRCHDLIAAYLSLDLDARLVIAGDYTVNRDYCLRLKKMCEGKEKVQFVGPKYGHDKLVLISESIAVVLPSAVEGHPMVLLEAMGLSKAVICSDIEENKFAVGAGLFNEPDNRNAIIFRLGDLDSLAGALAYAFENQVELSNISARAFRFVSSKYSSHTMIRKYLAIYRQLGS